MKENCKHDEVKLVGIIMNTDKCFKCGKQLSINEIEILNIPHEVGAFCDNEKCERFLLLTI